MLDSSDRSVVEGEVRALRQEVAELRAGQAALMKAVEEMTQTFRSIAVHLGIASEPYKKGGAGGSKKEIPGFA